MTVFLKPHCDIYRKFSYLIKLILFFVLIHFCLLGFKSVICYGLEKNEKHIIAEIGKKVITRAEMELPIITKLSRLENEINQLRKKQLEALVAQEVIQLEAQQKGVSVQQLINTVIDPDKVEISNEEVEGYYEENRELLKRYKLSETELKEQVRMSLQQKKVYEKVMDYAASLYDKYDVKIHLETDYTRVQVSVTDNPTLGSAEAAVTVVEFSDYTCPACRQIHGTVEKLKELYNGQVRWIFKNYPLNSSKNSFKAAQSGYCAKDQGKFWEYHSWLFETKSELSDELMVYHAEKLGLNAEKFAECLKSEKYTDRIMKDIEDGKKIGIQGTPTLIVEGRILEGAPPFEYLKGIIEEELKSSSKEKVYLSP